MPEPSKIDGPFHEEYQKLRSLAAAFVRRNARSTSLSATVLVHEAYLRLTLASREYKDRAHFMATAATAMRQILVDHARARQRQKRGGELWRITLDADQLASAGGGVDLLVLNDALSRLEDLDPRQAGIVEMRFFAGLSTEEIAEVFGISDRTVKRDWAMARAWLQKELLAGTP